MPEGGKTPKNRIPFYAALMALPNTAVIWGVIIYTVFGITGEAPSGEIHLITLSIGFMLIYGWTYHGSSTVADVVYQSCRLGMVLALLIPVSTGTVSVLWALEVVLRPDGLLNRFSLIEIPVFATTGAMLLILLYLAGSYLAARHIDRVPF